MIFLKVVFWSTLGIFSFLQLGAYVCYRITFYSSPKRPEAHREEYPIPNGKEYEPFRQQIIDWIKFARALPYREVSIQSHDGLTLRGRYYEFSPDAPIELMIHGYRGWGERDMSGGVYRCQRLGHNALVIDQRASNESDGTVITFGILEQRDCRLWVDYIVDHINPNAKIILTGISMGASTVMLMSSQELPKNVVGVLADCGYTSNKEIIQKVMRDIKLPPKLLYPLVKMGARLYGKFDLDERSPIEEVQRSRLPILFFHGDADGFVPHSMSIQNYEACVTSKRLVIIKGAGHGLSFPVDPETYLREMQEFFDPILQKSSF
jgi:fermentation-respiration switch protein FrsA (DUF1100 family)